MFNTKQTLYLIFFIGVLCIPGLIILDCKIESLKTKSINQEVRIRNLENTIARLVSKKVILYPSFPDDRYDKEASTQFADKIIEMLNDINDLFLSEKKLDKKSTH